MGKPIDCFIRSLAIIAFFIYFGTFFFVEYSPGAFGIHLGLFVGIFALGHVCKKIRGQTELDDEFSVHNILGMPTQFSYNDLKTATNDFNNKIGEGGFGSVFKGTLSDGTEVAVKRLAGLSKIKKSFLAEVQTIGSIHHVNLVRLIGFCAENSNRLLVYDYMSNGSLDRWIFKRHQELTLGKGEEGQLLDMVDKYNADMQLHGAEVVEMMKLAVWCLQSDYQRRPSMTMVVQVLEGFISVQDNLDFNFINAPGDDMDAVHEECLDLDQSQVVAMLRGTLGYMTPKWFSSIVTEKVDVYSFGVVVLEILCGRKNLDRSGGDDEAYCAVSTVRSDYERRASMTVVVQVLEGFVSVQDNLDYNFINAPARRTMAATREDMHAIDDGTPLLASVLSGPRELLASLTRTLHSLLLADYSISMASSVILMCKYGEVTLVVMATRGFGFNDLVESIHRKWQNLGSFELFYAVADHHNCILDNDEDFCSMIALAAAYGVTCVDLSVGVISSSTIECVKSLGGQNGECVRSFEYGECSTFQGEDEDPLDKFCIHHETVRLSADWVNLLKCVGQEFRGGVDDFKACLSRYAVEVGFKYKYLKNDRSRVTAECCKKLDG
ncbi:hypothetical protein RHGRI_038637 [Rhododendron griersonianum]|uniref:Protein kinase domain-containing protein n=1 Tax=Rhododendron griersonianum TaxID=479676 RepID=A0AAV6HJJ7_9ERIC|nr:hypothetical protein RHGRI_038637 [Rhododendron griersonianum]